MNSAISDVAFPPPLAGKVARRAGGGSSQATAFAETAPSVRFADSSPASGGAGRGATRLDAIAKDFEAVFIAEMLAPLFSSIETPAIAGGSKSEEFFRSLLQESYAKAMAERGGFGIAAHVKTTLIDLQGARSAATLQETQ